MTHTATLTYVYLAALFILFTLLSSQGFGQNSPKINLLNTLSITDSLLAHEDSAVYYSLYATRKKIIEDQINQLTHPVKLKKPIPRPSLVSSISTQPILNIGGGYISSATNYRSVIDTPYAEKNILQHNLNGRLYFIIGGALPLQLNYLIRNSNSSIFKDIYDVQLSLDPGGFRTIMNNNLRKKFEGLAASYEDSIKEKLLLLETAKLNLTKEWLKNPLESQRILEAKEILAVPGITFKPNLSPELNQEKESGLRDKAAKFLALYDTVDSLYDISFGRLDSMKKDYSSMKAKAARLRQFGNNGFSNYSSYTDWKRQTQQENLPDVDIPKKYQRLMAIRSLSLGRTPLNYSDLTAKNISIKGINFEYNSWYYVAFSAGMVDARFRDFSIGRARNKQYLVMARLGIGNLDKSIFILSAFKGRKQLFTATSNQTGITNIDITGFSAESKWKIDKNTSITAEVAQTISPDFQSGDLSKKTSFNLSDKSNKAYSFKFFAYYPLSKTRLEASYKFTGANYQSFSSFQTNSALTSWYIKGEQQFLGRMLKLSAAIRTNDFSNPYIIQQYKSNTVFKSVNIAFRKSKWPALSVGYQPMSQLTVVDNYVTENRFQSLNATGYHYYTVGSIKTASTAMFNKFYNHNQDTGFVYFNASSIYFGQNIFLGTVTASLAVSDTRNNEYQTQVFDESLQMKVAKSSALLLGVKINNFNNHEIKVGTYANTSLKVWKNDILYLSYERAFLPGYSKRLIKNDIATIQFIKFFGSANYN